MNIKLIVLLFFTLRCQFSYTQVDDIEYNIWEQIYDFGITNSQYYFRTWDKKTMIEKDSFVFDINRIFANNPVNYQSDYADSIEITVSSRTLKTFYNEKIMYNMPNEYIRICWLRYQYQVILKFEDLKSENIKISLKIGDGCYERHGEIIYDTTFYIAKKYTRKIKRVIDIESFNNLENGMECYGDWRDPRVFFFEFKTGGDDNTVVISECSLNLPMYRNVIKLYKIARTISRKKKLLPKEQML